MHHDILFWISDVKLSMISANRYMLNADPWWSPTSIGNFANSLQMVLTLVVVPLYMS